MGNWIDDYAVIATVEQLEKQRRMLYKNKKNVEDYRFKLNQFRKYIKEKKKLQ